MVDYTSLSDEELMKAAGISNSVDYTKLSDEELMKAAGVYAPKKDTSFSKGLAYGAENAIRGLSATSKFLGIGPQRSSADGLADLIHQKAGLDNYAPASAVVGDSSKGVGERLMSAPRALVEGAPGLATDLVAGGVAGPAGFLISNSARNLGENVEASKGDLTKALGVTAADAILSRFGARATVGSAAKNLVKAAGTDAGVGTAMTVLDKDYLRGEKSTPGDIAVNALTGLGVGVAGRSAEGFARMPKTPEGFKDQRFNPTTDKLDQDSLSRVANVYDKARADGSKDDYNYAHTHFDTEVKNALENGFFKKQLKDDGLHDDVKEIVSQYKNKLKDGQVLTEDDIGSLYDIIGSTAEGQKVVTALTDRNTLNQLNPLYDGGLSQSKLAEKLDPNTPGFNPIRSVDFHTLWRALRGQGIGIPEMAIGAAQLAVKPITKTVDRLTGAADPSGVLIDRFAGKEAPRAPVDSYSVTVQKNLAEQTRAKLDAAQAKADAKVMAQVESLIGKLGERNVKQSAKEREKATKALEASKIKSTKEATENIIDTMGNLGGPETFIPRRIGSVSGRDMAEPASLPENPGYGSASSVDPRDLAFNALLVKKTGVKDLNRITQFDNAELMDPSQIPANDPQRAQIEHFLQKIRDVQAEKEYDLREIATAKAMESLGISTRNLPTPDAPTFTRGDMTGAFPEPKLLQPPPIQTAEAPVRSDNLARIDEILSGKAGRPKATKTPVEEAMAPRKETPKSSPMEAVIREVDPDVYRVKTKEGDVVHATGDTWFKEDSRAAKTREYANSRNAIWRSGSSRISGNARPTYNRHLKDWQETVRGFNNEQEARAYIDKEVLPKFSKADQEKLLNHFENHTPNLTIKGEKVKGRSFFDTWVHKTKEKADEARAKNREIAAKRKKAEEEDE